MMGRIQLEAVGLEFEEHGNTIWLHGPHGTLLRIKCSGQITVKRCEASGPHADVSVPGDIEFCVPGHAGVSPGAGDTRGGARPGRVLSGSGTVQAVGRRAGAVPAAQTVVRGTGSTGRSRTVRGGRAGSRSR